MRLPPDGVRGFAGAYLMSLSVRQYSEDSVECRAQYLELFAAWCTERGLLQPGEVTKPILERYRRHLFLYRKKDGRPLGASSQYQHLVSVKEYFRWLTREDFLLYNPASELEMPRLPFRLPRAVLTAEEVEVVLAQPDLRASVGLRDRAIMETLYSTGIRRKETCGLHVHDVDFTGGAVMVRNGKGKRDRLVPIGERALAWVGKYIDEARQELVAAKDEGLLFLMPTGESIQPDFLSGLVSGYVDAASLGKKGACHLFRHTMATLMLEGGADTRFIQALLGHASLTTTQLYTQVAIRKLKDIHAATHPAAKLARRDERAGESGATRNTLLSALAAEAAEDDESLSLE